MKKKLLLIGNGPIPIDISDNVNEFDYVLRINRMTNLPTTGDKIDGIFIGAYNDFFNIYKGGEFKEYFKKAKDIFLTQKLKERFEDKWKDYLTKEQWENLTLLSFKNNVGNVKANPITTTIIVLDVLTTFPEWHENYEIWIAGITVEGRGQLMSTGEPWSKTLHKMQGYKEECFLKLLLKEKTAGNGLTLILK